MIRGWTLTLAAVLASAGMAWAQGTVDLASLMGRVELKNSLMEGQTDTWTVPFDSSAGDEITVYVTYSNDRKEFALVFATVLDGPEGAHFDRDTLERALKLSNDIIGVKLAYDEKYGDLDCQSEVYLGEGSVTPQELARAINTVAEMTDRARTELKEGATTR